MQFNSLLSAVLSGQFLLEESAVPAFQLQVAQLLTAQASAGSPRPADAPVPAACFAISADATSVQLRGYGSLDDVPTGSIAVTLVNGVMLPDDHYDQNWNYVPGTRTLGARIQQADAHANIVGHVGWFITPGGSTLGVEAFADVIAGTAKPFVSYVDMMCSAGAWSGSGANQVVVSKTGIGGSIGTKWDGLDFSKYYEKLGITSVTVTATESTEKTKAFDEALKGKPALLRTQLLDPLNDVFVATMKAYRPGMVAEATNGRLFVGQALVDAGLADQVGSLQDAIQRAFDLAQEGLAAASAGSLSAVSTFSFSPTTPHSNPPTNLMGLFGNKPTAFAAVLALAAKTTITEAEATAANAELAAAGIENAALITKTEYTDLSAKAGRAVAAEAKVTELTTANTTLTTDLQAAQAEVTRLGALAGAAPTTAGPAATGQPAPQTHAWFDPKASHNQEAEALLG